MITYSEENAVKLAREKVEQASTQEEIEAITLEVEV